MNNGAWSYVGPRINTTAENTEHHKGKYPYYAGRGPTSSVATGSKVRLRCAVLVREGFADVLSLQIQHKKEIEQFLHAAFHESGR